MSNGQFSPGDILVTSGTGGIFPPNIPVAKVTSRGRDSALATPLARPDALDYGTVMKAYMPPPPAVAPDSRP
jgi:rod shape-determining protein MreC